MSVVSDLLISRSLEHIPLLCVKGAADNLCVRISAFLVWCKSIVCHAEWLHFGVWWTLGRSWDTVQHNSSLWDDLRHKCGRFLNVLLMLVCGIAFNVFDFCCPGGVWKLDEFSGCFQGHRRGCELLGLFVKALQART